MSRPACLLRLAHLLCRPAMFACSARPLPWLALLLLLSATLAAQAQPLAGANPTQPAADKLLNALADPAPWVAGPFAPGTQNYPNAGLQFQSDLGGELKVFSGGIDPVNQVGYFGVFNQGEGSPVRVMKVALGEGVEPPRRLQTLMMGHRWGAWIVRALAIDVQHGYGYLLSGSTGLNTVLHKFSLGGQRAPMRYLGELVLPAAERSGWNLAIDPLHGYGYVGCGPYPSTDTTKVVKCRLGEGDALPTRVSALSLAPNDTPGYPSSFVIDPQRGWAYLLLTDVGKNRLIKLALGEGDAAPTRVNILSPPELGVEQFRKLLLDPVDGTLYLSTVTSSNKHLVKLSPAEGESMPTMAGIVAAPGDPAGIDRDRSYLYCVESSSVAHGASRIHKLKLLPGTDVARLVASQTLLTDETYAELYLDAEHEKAVVLTLFNYSDNTDSGGYNSKNPARIVSMTLGEGDTAPQLGGAVTLPFVDEIYDDALFDDQQGYAYLITRHESNMPQTRRLIKVKLPRDGSPSLRLGGLVLDSAFSYYSYGAIDPANGVGYLVGDYNCMIKVRLGAGDALPTAVGTFNPPTAEGTLSYGAFDFHKGYAYLTVAQNRDRIAKVRLGLPDEPVTFLGSIATPCSYLQPLSRVAEPGSDRLFFTGYTTSGTRLLTIDSSTSDALPSVRSNVALQVPLSTYDPVEKVGYGMTKEGLSKVSLGDGTTTPTLMAFSPSPDSTLGYWNEMVIDPVARIAFVPYAQMISYGPSFQILMTHLRMAKFGLRPGNQAPVFLGMHYFDDAVRDKFGMHVDPLRRLFYLVAEENWGAFTQYDPDNLRCYRYGFDGAARMTRLEVPESGALRSVTLYSHAAGGHVRLGLYREDAPGTRTLVWESASTTNTEAAAMLTIPAAAGVPAAPLLHPGTYHLAWQVDTPADVPSFVEGGGFGDGASLELPYGAFPAQLRANDATTSWTTSTDRWSGFIAYGTRAGVQREAWTHY